MRYCRCESKDFPESQFELKANEWFHCPPGGTPHLAEGIPPEPPPAPLRMMTAMDLQSLADSAAKKPGEKDGEEDDVA